VNAIWQILIEFLLRLTFGVAATMAITPSRQVTSGFFRVHLWVLMGVQTFAALAIYSTHDAMPARIAHLWQWQFGLTIAAAVISYVGAVIWMYEQRLAGKIAIVLVAACALAGCTLPVLVSGPTPVWAILADRVTGGLVLGSVTTAMLLGHWYLNTPTMQLAPLRRLIVLIAVAIGLRMLLCGIDTGLEYSRLVAAEMAVSRTWWLFIALRWLSGLLGTLGLTWLTWKTLDIPNTQSATGILYAAMIVCFIGELTAQLLSAEAVFPL
jgi:hypothetical protein